MTDPESLRDASLALSRYFLGDETLGTTLSRVADATTVALPQAEFVGLTLMMDGKLGTFVFTHPEVPDIDRAQYDTGDGPCIESFLSGDIITIPIQAVGRDVGVWGEDAGVFRCVLCVFCVFFGGFFGEVGGFFGAGGVVFASVRALPAGAA